MAGNVKQRPDGTWRARWNEYAGGPERSKAFRTKKEAVAHLAEVRTSIARGVYVAPEIAATSFAAYVDVFLERQVWRRATRINGESIIGRAVAHWGDRPISTIRRADIQAYAVRLSADGLAASTVALHLRHLGAVFRMAVDDGVIGRNPSVGVKKPTTTAGRIDPLTLDEVRRLESAAPPWFRIAIILGADLGLRQSEVRGLGVESVRFLRREVRIDRQAERDTAGYAPPKTANSVRTIPADSTTLDELAAHLAEHGTAERVLHRDGRYVTGKAFGAAFRVAREGAGLPTGVRFHDLRHHCASELLGDGISLVAVASILGDTPTTVLTTYGHLVALDEDRARASMRRRRLVAEEESPGIADESRTR